MAYSAKAIANEFLQLAEDSGDTICPMRMQKLVYFAHGWYLALKGLPLITEEIEAWPYGPVIESLYHEFKIYGADPITAPVLDVDIDDSHSPKKIKIIKPATDSKDSFTKAFLYKVWDVYKNDSAIGLSKETHKNGSPWSNTKLAGKRLIDNEEIERYFKSKIKR